MVFNKWARELAEAIEASTAPDEPDFAKHATPVIERYLERRLHGRSYWSDQRKWGRVWSGPFSPDDTLHYGYTDGELLPDGRLCWTVTRSSEPSPGMHQRISEAEAMALLLSRKWPNLELEGWDHAEATNLLAAFLYDQPVKAQCA